MQELEKGNGLKQKRIEKTKETHRRAETEVGSNCQRSLRE